MRRLVKRNKENEAPVEDVEIQYYAFDDHGNTSITRVSVEVPLGCGKFAQAAMLKGFFEFFNKPLLGPEGPSPDQKVTLEHIERSIESWNRIAAQAHQPKPAAPGEPTQPEITPQ